MARVLIAEPVRDVRELLEVVVAQLGYEPVVWERGPPEPPPVDIAVIEPGGDGRGIALAWELRSRDPQLPIVFVSIYPRGAAADELAPVAYLLKPFGRRELASALARASTSPGRGVDPQAQG